MLPKESQFYFTSSNSPRALDHETLLKIAQNRNIEGKSFATVNDAIEDALKITKEDDLIIVSGSIYVAGDVDRDRFC